MTYEGPVGGLGYGNGGFGNGWEGLIGLALVAGLFDGGFNGFGGGRGSNGEVQRGFDTQAITSKLDGISNGICDSTFALNNSINGVQQTLCQGFSGMNMSVYQNGTETRAAITDLGYRMQDCCCQTQRAIDGVNYNMAKNTCDIIQANNANTQRLIDLYTSNKISSLEADKAALTAQLSQNAQTATILNAVNRTPIPAYTVPNPYAYGCGCNQGCGSGYNVQ